MISHDLPKALRQPRTKVVTTNVFTETLIKMESQIFSRKMKQARMLTLLAGNHFGSSFRRGPPSDEL